MATAAVYLCSDAASWVTGKLLEVDGGWCFELLPRSIPDLQVSRGTKTRALPVETMRL